MFSPNLPCSFQKLTNPLSGSGQPLTHRAANVFVPMGRPCQHQNCIRSFCLPCVQARWRRMSQYGYCPSGEPLTTLSLFNAARKPWPRPLSARAPGQTSPETSDSSKTAMASCDLSSCICADNVGIFTGRPLCLVYRDTHTQTGVPPAMPNPAGTVFLCKFMALLLP